MRCQPHAQHCSRSDASAEGVRLPLLTAHQKAYSPMSAQKKPATVLFNRGQLRLVAFASLFIALSLLTPYVIYKQLGAQTPALDGRWMSWPFAGACILLLAVYFSCDGLRLLYILKALGYKLPLRAMGPLVFINIFVSNITPMATGGGIAQIWYLLRHDVPVGAATAATSLRTLQAVLFIFIPTPIILLAMPQSIASLSTSSGWYIALFASVYVGFFTVVLLKLRWVVLLIDLLLAPLAKIGRHGQNKLARRRFRARRILLGFSHAFFAFFRGPRRYIILSLLFTFLFLLTLFSFPALLLWGLGYHIDYTTSVSLLIITTFIMYFAPTPGAAGVAEGAFGLFFASLVAAGDLVLVILAWRFLTIHLGMLIGLPITLRTLFSAGTKNA